MDHTSDRPPFVPWPHQERAFVQGRKNLYELGHRSTAVVSATGTGKTTIAAMFAKHCTGLGKYVLFIAHRNELIAHAVEDFEAMGIPVALEKASSYARSLIYEAKNDLYNPRSIRAVVASVQTLKGSRLDKWPRDFFSEIYIDEFHHSLGRPKKGVTKNFLGQDVAAVNAYRAIVNHFASAKIIGFSATPRRDDGRRVEELYESFALQFPMATAISEKMLAGIEVRRSKIRIDLSAVKKFGFDLNQGQLEEAVLPFIQPMSNVLYEQIESRRFLVFTPGRDDVEQKIRPSEIFAAGINKAYGVKPGDPPVCYPVWGDHPDRESLIEGFKAGRIQGLVNAELLTEGFDCKQIEAIGLCRATTSDTLLEQIVGRGLRLCPEIGKEKLRLIDFDWGFNINRLSSIYHILSPDGTASAAEFAQEIAAEGVITDAMEIAAEAERRAKIAEQEDEKKRAEEDARRKHQEELAARTEEEKRIAREEAIEKAKQRAIEKATREEEERNRLMVRAVELGVVREASGMEFLGYDPFSSAFSLTGLADRAWPNTRVKASPRQVAVLAEYGVLESEAEGYTREQATEMNTLLWMRHIKNMARIDQVRDLLTIGYSREEAWSMTKSEARGCIREHEIRGRR